MRKNKTLKNIATGTVISVLFCSYFSIAQATWITGKDFVLSDVYSSINTAPTCYVYTSSSKKYFTDLGKAIDAAYGDGLASTIVVIPGNDATIVDYKGTHTLKSGDNLIVSYTDTTDTTKITANVDDGKGIADNDPETYRKSQVVFADSSKLTIESGAGLYIGGKTGGTSPQGVTTQDYSELVLGKNASIDNSGIINCYGFIKEKEAGTSSIVSHNGSSVSEPLAMYDWGSAGSALGKEYDGVFPFSQFDLPQIRSTMTFEYGSDYTVQFHSYGDKTGHITTPAVIFSKGTALLKALDPSSKLVKSNSDVDLDKTSTEIKKHRTKFKTTGNISLDSLNVNIEFLGINKNISSSSFYVPIPGTFDVAVDDGTFSIPNRVKFMPGSSLNVGASATIDATANVMFYQSNVYGTATMPSTIFTTPATLINNGTINLKAGFGGYIQTGTTNSKIITSTNDLSINDCNESTLSIGLSNIGGYGFGTLGHERVGPFSFEPTFDWASDNNGTNLTLKKTIESDKNTTSTTSNK